MLKIVLMYCGFAEQMGTQILDDLHSQRSTIQRARDRVCSCWVLYFFQNIEDSDFCYHQFFSVFYVRSKNVCRFYRNVVEIVKFS